MGIIKLLDCSLRDGGHQVKSNFGKKVIQRITGGLEKANIDYIEVGFLRNGDWSDDYAIYNSINDAENKTKLSRDDLEYTLLVQQDEFNVDKLLPFNGGKFRRIRVSFHEHDKNEGILFCRKVIEKGYICHMNPINTVGYKDADILEFVRIGNEIGIGAFSIVDTFGSMSKDDLIRLLYLISNNLNANIDIGIHLHDNMMMAFGLSQIMCENISPKRNHIIDASLLGMGRDPGNLCIELIADWLNNKYNASYDIDVLFDLIDDYIRPIKEKNPWGYATAYALSAQYYLHRSYGEYLMNKGKINSKSIRHILSKIDKNKVNIYDENYIESLYQEYISFSVDDSAYILEISRIFKDRCVLILAPGKSLVEYREVVKDFIEANKPIVISVNFESDLFNADYIFCGNLKRYEILKENENLIVTSNILLSSPKLNKNIISINRVAYFNGKFWDNSALMLFNLLAQSSVDEWFVAGFDGFSSEDNFAISGYDIHNIDVNSENARVKSIMNTTFSTNEIHFLTPSYYQKPEV